MIPGAGVRPEQGPPLAVPMSFFAAGVLCLAAAGVWLAAFAAPALANRYMPGVLGLTHLLTMGFFGLVMLGALYQMVPVVAGAPVPAPRLAFAVLALWIAALVSLLFGFLTGAPVALYAAGVVAGLAAALFLGPVAVALARAPTRSATVSGLRLALVTFALVVALGALLAALRAGARPGVPQLWALSGHAGLGALGWIAGLILAVSWQVLPMFYTAPEAPRGAVSATRIAGFVGVLGVGLALLGDAPATWAQRALVPLAIASLGLAPAVWWRILRARRRRRTDPSARLWWVGLGLAPIVAASGLAAWLRPEPKLTVLAGWLFLFGFAGTILHGMLSRIVPFLAWFHRFSAQMGKAPVPPMRALWPEARVQLGLRLHLGALALGAAAILTESDLLARAAGVGLVAVAAVLARGLLGALRGAASPSPSPPAP